METVRVFALMSVFVALSSAAPSQDSDISGTLCLYSVNHGTRTDVTLPSGARVSETISLPEGLTLCTSCDDGWSVGLYARAQRDYIQLTERHILVLSVDTCQVKTTFNLNVQCTPKYIQRSPASSSNRYYVICQNGPRYQQLDYDSSSGEYHLSFHLNDSPSSPAAAIVEGTNRFDDAVKEDIAVTASGNTLEFDRQTFHYPLDEYDNTDCVDITTVHPMAPDDGKPQVVVTCGNASSDGHRYVVGISSTQSIEASGTPALSPLGDYLLVVLPQGLQLYRTTDLSYASSTYTADILEVQFHQSGVGLYLSVAVAGQALRLLDVDTFVASGGSNGEVVLAETASVCSEGDCSPHGLAGLGLKLDIFVVFTQEQSSYTATLYSLVQLDAFPQTVKAINAKPDLFLFAESPSPSPSVHTSTLPSTPMRTNEPTPTPPSPPTVRPVESSNDLQVWIISLTVVFAVTMLVLIPVVFTFLCVHKHCRQKLRNGCIKLSVGIEETFGRVNEPTTVAMEEQVGGSHSEMAVEVPTFDPAGATRDRPTPSRVQRTLQDHRARSLT